MNDKIFKEQKNKIERLQGEVNMLRQNLEKYTSCRHGCVNCFCTKEACFALGKDN